MMIVGFVMGFAIIIVKQLYGGLGYNPFNPAMAAYVFLLISFPAEMSAWLPPAELNQNILSLGQTISVIFTGSLTWDAVTMATPLDASKTELGLNLTWSEILSSPLYGSFAGHGWEWINTTFLIGGVWLWQKRAIDWRIPLGMLSALFLVSLLFYIADADSFGSPIFHLFSGASMIAAFFIATDLVTSPVSVRGQLLFGAGCGLFIFVIRTWAGYPEGVAFAIMLMNACTPLIDHYFKPRIYGRDRRGEPLNYEQNEKPGSGA